MKNILFVRLRLLGDIIFTIPAIELYRNKYPESKIFYVVEEKFSGIAEMIPGIDKVMTVPHKMSLKDLIKFRREVKKISPDGVVDFHSGPKSALLTRISGAKIRIGYRSPNRNWAYTHLCHRKYRNTFIHSVLNQSRLLETLGITVKNIPRYPPVKIGKTNPSELVRESLLTKNKKAVIHVGAGNKFREWSINKFSDLIKRLIQENISIFLIGSGEKEEKNGAHLTNNYKNVLNFTGKLTISELFYLISKADVYFGIDSGPLHLASLTKTPLVAVYGPNITEISGPWRDNAVTIVQNPLKCRPCSQRRCIHDTIKCIDNIKTDKVYEAIIRYL